MKNIIITLAALLSLNSCQSQNNVDLLQLKFGDSIENIVKKENYKEDRDSWTGIIGYQTDVPKKLTIGNIPLQSYKYPNGDSPDYNNLYIFIKKNEDPTYLGFRYTSVNQKESSQILDYIKKKYKDIDIRNVPYFTEAFYTNIEELDAWLFVRQFVRKNHSGNEFFNTDFVFIKRGTRIENSIDPNYNTILQNFDWECPKE